MQISYKTKIALVITIAMIGIVSVIAIKPIAQNPAYHSFADKRCLASIPNFWNVVSNIPFLIIGAIGMFVALFRKLNGMLTELKLNLFVFFLGVFFCCIGSMYYHYNPNTVSLFWDRLPMTVSFMAFFSIIIGEHISIKAGQILLPQLLLIGVLSILYWNMTEREGYGDLRFYGLVQFLPFILIPVIVVLFKSKFNTNLYLWLVAASYIAAKLLEHFDYAVYECGNFMGGHALKHFSAAAAPLMYLLGLYKRKQQVIVTD
jgi:hypothetical protein